MLTDADIMAQVLEAFREEQAEHRRVAGELLLELERAPNHPQRQALLDELFREAHSLKGSARAARQDAIEQLAHRVEDVLSGVRQGTIALTPEVCDPVYAALDAVGALTEQGIQGETGDLLPYQPLMDDLARIVKNAPPRPSTHQAVEAPAPAPPEARQPTELKQFVAETGPETVRLPTTALDRLLHETGELLTCTVRAQQRIRDTRSLAETASRWRRVWRQVNPVLTRLQEAAPVLSPTVHHLERTAPATRRADTVVSGHNQLSEQDINTLLLTLTQANTLISEFEQRAGDVARLTSEDSTRLATVTERLHSQIRRTRMLPVDTLFSPLRLQAREIARNASKQVELELDDGDAEADRQVLEQLREVLLHLLRNAIDHGIESSAARVAAGKPAAGQITLRAQVSGDHLTLTLADDGAGVDLEAVRRRGISAGIIGETDLVRVTDAELLDIIFLPGFSTKQTVSTLSGRGVGLDIVRSQIERMHGRVTVQSVVGKGCVFTITVPLSLTSAHGLLLRVAETRYIVPLDTVQRIITIAPRDIRYVEGRTIVPINGRPVVLTQLSDLLGANRNSRQPSLTTSSTLLGGYMMALLLGSGERQVACLVDEVLDEQELVVQRLPMPLQRVRFVAGATILADGAVIPILDVVDLLNAAIGLRQAISVEQASEEQKRTPHILVVDDSITTRTLEKNILEAAGYHVRLATDGVEALTMLGQMLENGGCDLLLSDVDMPRVNGFELARQVRSDTRCPHLPIVLVTSLDTAEDRERGIAAGADAYIVKRTFDQHTLLETIAQLIA